MVELEVPAMVHVAPPCNPNFHGTGAHYINGDTTAFMPVHHRGPIPRFPDAEIRHSARRRRGALSLGRYGASRTDNETPAAEGAAHEQRLLDTCVHHQPGIDLLLKVIPADNILFASEMVGAVKGVDRRPASTTNDTSATSIGSTG